MKNVKALTLAAISTVAMLTSCGQSTAASSTATPSTGDQPASSQTASSVAGQRVKITMLTDVGTIDDKNFNQGTWEGLKAWADAKGLVQDQDYNYIRPAAGDTANYENAMEDAIAKGANVIVCPGYLFQEAFETITIEHPDVAFVGLDFTQNNIADAKNAVNITFKENEAGFLAGYAAVAEGLSKVGFMGGMFGNAVARYGIGYAAGVAYANKALGKTTVLDKENVWYSGTFSPSDSIQNTIAGWYSTGNVDAVFAAAGGAGNSVIAAAKKWNSDNASAAPKSVIGVDIDQGSQDNVIITSAMKGLAIAVGDALDNIVKADLSGINDSFSMGGKSTVLGAKENAVALPTVASSWRFKTFTQDEYKALFEKISSGAIVVPTYDGDPKEVSQLTDFFAQQGAGVSDDVASYLYNGK